MESYKYSSSDIYPQVNPNWRKTEVRDLVARHKSESVEAGIYDSFAKTIFSNLEVLKDHISPRQEDLSIFIAVSDAPMVVLTDYDEVNDELHIRLAKVDPLTGWLLSAAERYHTDTSIVNVGVVLSDGRTMLNDNFTEQQLEILNSQKAEYAGLGINFARASKRHVDNQAGRL